jgi:sugar transferase (PEP-CTERM system associated)
MRIRLLGQYVHISVVVLALIEASLFFVMMYGAVFLRLQDDLAEMEGRYGPIWYRAALFSGIMLLCLLALGLYSARQRARAGGIVVRMAIAVTVGITLTVLAFYMVPSLTLGRGVLALAAIGSVAGLIIVRVIFSRVVDESIFKRRVLVFGTGRNAEPIARLRRRSDRRGFSVAGFVRPDGEEVVVPAGQIIDPTDGLAATCARLDVDEVIVAMNDRRREFPILELLECRLAGIDVTDLLTFLERETGCVRIDVLNPSWMIFGEGFRRSSLRLLSSRIVDVVASGLIVIVTLPVMLLTVLAIKLEDGFRAPVFYGQVRVGLNGSTFRVLKFRSMRIDAERNGAQWAVKGDSRVTRVGSFIRKTRIDEIPQILCVLRGHMSFVGPRPERPEFVAEFSQKIPYYQQRHCVKPGITGWAQLCYPYGSSEKDAVEKLQYDLYYIKNNTLLFDLAILLQTVEVVVMGQGAR